MVPPRANCCATASYDDWVWLASAPAGGGEDWRAVGRIGQWGLVTPHDASYKVSGATLSGKDQLRLVI